MELIYQLVACHAIGDYVLQNDFLARTKGENWWHLIIHCILYTIPFSLVFGFDGWIFYLFATHMIIDALKARYNKVDYVMDQIYHFCVLVTYAVMIF